MDETITRKTKEKAKMKLKDPIPPRKNKMKTPKMRRK